MRLKDVAYYEDFACNVVSLRHLLRKGYCWNTEANQIYRRKDKSVVCQLTDCNGQFVIEYVPLSAAFTARKHTSWTGRKPSEAEALLWHGRLGHPGRDALANLNVSTTGAKLQGPNSYECPACSQAKAKRRIRHEPRELPRNVGEVIAIDFLDLTPDPMGFNSAMLFTDRRTGYVFDVYLSCRSGPMVEEGLNRFIATMIRQHGLTVKAIQCDNELVKSRKMREYWATRGIKIEPCAPYSQSQNGGAERSEGVIKMKARALRMAAKLPALLWVEIYKATVYLYNRTPKKSLSWRSPYEDFHTFVAKKDGIPNPVRKPQISHLRNYSCKAFAMTNDALKKTNRLNKLEPNAWISYLVGYDSTNIYRVWNPKLNRVIRVRDVTFNEDEFYNGDLDSFKDNLLNVTKEEMDELIRTCEIHNDEAIPMDLLNQGLQSQEEDEDEEIILDSITVRPLPVETDSGEAIEVEDLQEENLSELNSPDHSEREVELEYETDHLVGGFNAGKAPGSNQAPVDAVLERVFAGLNLKEEEVGDTATAEEVEELHAAFAAARINPRRLRQAERYEAAFTAQAIAENPPLQPKPRSNSRYHRKDLPPPPTNYRHLRRHPLNQNYRKAMEEHMASHREMGSFEECSPQKANNHQILACMWVFTYKFDKVGYLLKVKARLVVRGDQQRKGAVENTYASTLAGKSFRTLITIAARFDMELIQYDVVNAFVHTNIPYDVFMKMPDGYTKKGRILQLRKALYGLRESPLL